MRSRSFDLKLRINSETCSIRLDHPAFDKGLQNGCSLADKGTNVRLTFRENEAQ
jgi:hypothetical protein